MKQFARIFWEFFKISLLVIGGGHAIAIVADDVFSRRLKWTKPNEIIDALPLIQSFPGLIAGNTAIYVGWKMAGRFGALVALIAVAVPPLVIFLGVCYGITWLPVENPHMAGALLGLRAALVGIVASVIVRSWRKTVRNLGDYIVMALTTAALLCPLNINPAWAILIAALVGILRHKTSDLTPATSSSQSSSFSIQFFIALAAVIVVACVSPLARVFLKFGCSCFGGGYPLVAMYLAEFVGPAAPMLQLPAEEFASVIALTQATPGPVSINAATFFGFRLGGILGAIMATASLLVPSYFILTSVLGALKKWCNSRWVGGALEGVKPATNALMFKAVFVFAGMSIFTQGRFSLLGLALALSSFLLIRYTKLPVMVAIFLSALVGAVL